MRVRRVFDLESFYSRAEPWLLKHEIENNFILSLTSGMLRHPERFRSHPLLLLLESDDATVGAAIRSDRRRPLVVSDLPLAGVNAVLDAIAEAEVKFNELFAPGETAAELARLAGERSAVDWRVKMRLALYSLERMPAAEGKSAPRVTGEARLATEDDLPTVCNWYVAFCREAMREDAIPDPELLMRRRIQDRTVYLWFDGEPACLVLAAERTPNGVRINGVYTPREKRSRGYATACVAEVSRRTLAAGSKFCCLFTDVANATSNSIYTKIGYQQHGEYLHMEAKPWSAVA